MNYIYILRQTNLGHGTANTIHQLLEVHQAKEGLLLETMQFRSKSVLLVLQNGSLGQEITQGQRETGNPHR